MDRELSDEIEAWQMEYRWRSSVVGTYPQQDASGCPGYHTHEDADV